MTTHTPGMRRWLLTLEEENKMTTQPEALKSANKKQKECHMLSIKSAAELRRLHESNTELLEALKAQMSVTTWHEQEAANELSRAAITKAEGEQK